MRPKSSALYRLRCEVSGRIRDRAIVARQPSSGTALEEGILMSVETAVAFPGHKFVGLYQGLLILYTMYILRTIFEVPENKNKENNKNEKMRNTEESEKTYLDSYVRARRR